MSTIVTMIKKQIKDTAKNKAILIQFVMFPLLTVFMEKAVDIQGMPENFFVHLYAAMYVGMAPLVSMASIISEEKEKNTLRVLMMAKVSPVQYLLGIGSYVFGACMLGSIVFLCLLNEETLSLRALFLVIMALGIIASVILGAALGVGSKNQMSATSVTVPVMLLFSFLPILSAFNEKIAKTAKIVYSEQIHILLGQLGSGVSPAEGLAVIFANILCFGVIFMILYKKRGLL